jgi:hypothetical protein
MDSGFLRIQVIRNDGKRGVFDFHVDDSGPIPILICDSVPSFDEFVGLQQSGGEEVLKALWAFHGARHG